MSLIQRVAGLLCVLTFSASLHAQINPDVCKQIRPDDVAVLLTLNQSTVESRNMDENRCAFEVKTPVQFIGSELELRMKTFQSQAEAVAYMKNEFPFYFDKHAPLVKTTGKDDHVDTVLIDPANGTAEAVHDNVMSRIDISGIEPSARNHPTFEYRLQRLALQAAGATVLPAVGLAPDPVPPHAPPPPAPASSASEFNFARIAPSIIGVLIVAAIVLIRRRRRT